MLRASNLPAEEATHKAVSVRARGGLISTVAYYVSFLPCGNGKPSGGRIGAFVSKARRSAHCRPAAGAREADEQFVLGGLLDGEHLRRRGRPVHDLGSGRDRIDGLGASPRSA